MVEIVNTKSGVFDELLKKLEGLVNNTYGFKPSTQSCNAKDELIQNTQSCNTEDKLIKDLDSIKLMIRDLYGSYCNSDPEHISLADIKIHGENTPTIIREAIEFINKHATGDERTVSTKLVEINDELIIARNCIQAMLQKGKLPIRLFNNDEAQIVYDNLQVIYYLSNLISRETRIQQSQNMIIDSNTQNVISSNNDSKKYEALEKEAFVEFNKYIDGDVIHKVTIEKYPEKDFFNAQIKLKGNNIATTIKVSEILNSKLYKENKIVSFSILGNNQSEILIGRIAEKGGRVVRLYDLSKLDPRYGLQFNWTTTKGKECSITLGVDNNGNIKILNPISDELSPEDVAENKDVELIIDGKELSLIEAVQKAMNVGSKLDKMRTPQPLGGRECVKLVR
ncbi:MAG: hypothetical protein QWI36_04395 [Wolbachia endosymbiont of Tyrophagus putrescentiae]|nr:hypothetical protein [Wolbachia endosymbiont of Tyrophagus putrescentiae]